MFPSGIVPIAMALLCGALVFPPVFATVPASTLRRAAVLGLVALGIVLSLPVASAYAQTVPAIAAPPGDTGFWASINGQIATGLGTVVVAALTWGVTLFTRKTGIQITAAREASLRETMKTGAFAAAEELELQIDRRWTPAQRLQVIGKMKAWAKDRAAAELKKLGLPDFVVTAMASKVLAGVLGPDNTMVTGELVSTGNPGETPALDRAAGPAHGGR